MISLMEPKVITVIQIINNKIKKYKIKINNKKRRNLAFTTSILMGGILTLIIQNCKNKIR
jgi:hypothetical protein